MTQVTIRKIKQNGCFPCEILGATIEDMKAELQAENVTVIEHNVSDEPEIATKYDLMGVPALIFERDGEEKFRNVGVISREEILYNVKLAKEGE